MTSILNIHNFKCFSSSTFSLGRLSVFCGANAVGKSTAIQAILLHRAALRAAAAGDAPVALNGPPGLALGTVGDIFHRAKVDSKIDTAGMKISFGSSGEAVEIDFAVRLDDEEKRYLTYSLPANVNFGPITGSRSLTYLSAERTGPRLCQEQVSNVPDDELTVGEHGQYAVEALVTFERSRIRSELVAPSRRGTSRSQANSLLGTNVEDWMATVFPGTQLKVERNGKFASPSMYFRRAMVDDDWTIATNYGFGVSSTLPIVVAGLLAPKNSWLIVDSPEAHLHPAAQTSLARFLCVVAAAGVNVILETHSDHIIDGVRIAVSERLDGLRASSCQLFYFSIADSGTSTVQTIGIKADGSLSSWPRGFFDQQSTNLRLLAQRKGLTD